jgi:hypothetical protein
MRIIEAYNSSGLTFTILPDRGMDIWTAHYKGIPLTWISQGSPHPPDFGQTWLQQFNGGLMTTCGLTHVGPPEKDDVTGEWRDIHGRYSRLRASDIQKFGSWAEWNGDDWGNGFYWAGIEAEVVEASLFGHQLRFRRKYIINLGNPGISIYDEVKNIGDMPSPLMLLYHFNLGFPLISQNTELITPHEKVYPRDEAAAAGFQSWQQYEAGSKGYAEQVFFHHVKRAKALTGDGGKKYPHGPEFTSLALIRREDLGLQVEWDSMTTLSYLTQWKNTRQGIYVSGIEPGNCIPEGLNAARRNNRIQMLQPGERKSFFVELTVIEGAEAMKVSRTKIQELQEFGVAVEGCHLDDYAQFAREL